MSTLTEAVTSNPKTGYLAIFATTVSNYWIEWGSPILSAVTTILGIVLLLVLIRKHLHETKYIIKKTDKK